MISFKTLMICFKIIIYIFLLLKFQLVYSQVMQSNEFAPFNKHLDVKGITLVGMYDVTDDFLIKVSKIIESCFETNEFTDKRLQKRLIKSFDDANIMQRIGTDMSNYKGGQIDEENYPGWDELHDKNNAVDFIFQLPNSEEGQILEIVEHFLHTTTVLGFNEIFHEGMWNYENKNSLLIHAMSEAINNGVYNIESYEEIKKDDLYAYNLIIAQEYAYWLIITAWDIKSIYIPNAEPEWFINTPIEIKQKNPLGYKLYNDYVIKVLSKPDLNLLNSLFINNSIYSISNSSSSENNTLNISSSNLKSSVNNLENENNDILINKIHSIVDELNNIKNDFNNNDLNYHIDKLIYIFEDQYL